ncbi:G5 and 3D domain-containing protein [Pontibacillus yanchengensis]|uniref:G5 and 3D domain-containing protein n=1 Tax=Pontibacillus yanchengensis TaxID=462910 RepID=UPI00069168E1|nr:G5 and 3D domain-containing protein [Pontibacillus yanchengensis]
MKKIILSVVSFVVFFALLGSFTYEATKAEVKVNTDKETKTVRTHASTVGELFSSLDIDVKPQDKLSHSTEEQIESGMKINYQSAKSVTVTIDDKEHLYYTVQDTVEDFIKAKNVNIDSRDQVSYSKKDSIEEGMNIEVRKAFEVTLNDGGKEKKVWTTAETVDQFLQEEDIKLDKLDKLKQDKTASLSKEQSQVKITRVEKVTDVIEESVDYGVVKRNDNSIPKGEEKVVQNGKKGKVVKHYEVTLENGEEVNRELVKKEKASDSKDKIVAVGTKEIQQNVSRSNNTSTNASAQKTLYMEATAYTAYCTGCSGVTTTGINLRANPNQKVVAVDPNVIPLGSRVWVEGYGYAVAGDTGSAIKGNRIDVFLSSKSQAYSFGRKRVQVKVLD